MSNELITLPCPFCGHLHAPTVEGDTFRWLAVQCPSCAARGPEIRVQTAGDGSPEEWRADGDRRAVKEWNTRSRAELAKPERFLAPQVTEPTVLRPTDRYELGELVRVSWLKHGNDAWCSIADDVIAALAQPEPEDDVALLRAALKATAEQRRAEDDARAALAAKPVGGGSSDEYLNRVYQGAYQPAWERGEFHGAHYDGLRAVAAAVAADLLEQRHPAPVPPVEDVLTDKELDALMPQQMRSDLEAAVVARSANLGFDKAIGICRFSVYKKARAYARAAIAAALARFDHQPAPPADGEVGELVAWLRDRAESTSLAHAARRITRAADLLEQLQAAPPAKVPATGLAAELVAWLNDHAINCKELGRADWAERCRVSAHLLEHHPAPVPVAIPGEEYHEDMGAVTWWRIPVIEPPWVGTPNDSDWPGYHTHFTPAPREPATALPLPTGEGE